MGSTTVHPPGYCFIHVRLYEKNAGDGRRRRREIRMDSNETDLDIT